MWCRHHVNGAQSYESGAWPELGAAGGVLVI